jgi:diadenosine tetraphosphate (Ap4A) HIT family hydrolase
MKQRTEHEIDWRKSHDESRREIAIYQEVVNTIENAFNNVGIKVKKNDCNTMDKTIFYIHIHGESHGESYGESYVKRSSTSEDNS